MCGSLSLKCLRQNQFGDSPCASPSAGRETHGAEHTAATAVGTNDVRVRSIELPATNAVVFTDSGDNSPLPLQTRSEHSSETLPVQPSTASAWIGPSIHVPVFVTIGSAALCRTLRFYAGHSIRTITVPYDAEVLSIQQDRQAFSEAFATRRSRVRAPCRPPHFSDATFLRRDLPLPTGTTPAHRASAPPSGGCTAQACASTCGR